uniref:NADH dehydrogenase subunit 5 n=1 Tax=Pachycondyla annamita TaxID=613577 RepID=UPI00255201C7|nr:NADH dehydrogenase subunit 5 [Pachycondyla annamita]WGF22860.1 NADH dehydrogenase subunit 5 [Pachycondyla annamita]
MMLMLLLIYMFILNLTFIMFSLYFYFNNQSLILEWLIMSMNSINIEFLIFMDWISFLFISVVMLISFFILIYSKIYMENNKFLNRFFYLLLLFVFSMILMIISPNLISIMFGWDGLGLISFCLVIFYQNYSSYNSGMMTVLINRIGDIFILMSIGLMMTYGSWNFFMLNKLMELKILLFLIILASMTKSAQMPFSYWLPLAMAAPTPISALVHSSTLVTAGVYLMIRFSKYMSMNDNMMNFLLFISILTMFMSGLMANFEYDLKKIIALSTLSQLGFMIMTLSMNLFMLSFYHLLIHAIFKSLLFMSVGNIIHLTNNNQDIRLMGNLSEFIPLTMMSFQITLFALCGFPFMSGFYSKDLIMEMLYFNKINVMMLLMSLISLMFTLIYSLRLIYYMSFKEMNLLSLNYIYENNISSNSMITLMILSILNGSMLNWLFFFDNFIMLNLNIKMMTIYFMMLSLFLFMLMKLLNYMNLYYLSLCFSTMWFLNFFIKSLINIMLKLKSKFFYYDKIWMEFYSTKMILQMYFNYKNYFLNYNYKIFMILYWFIFIIIFIYM